MISIRLLVLSFALPRVDDIFRRGRDHSEPICTCSKLLTIRRFALPNNDAFAVIDYKNDVYLSMYETRSAQSRRYFSPWSRPFWTYLHLLEVAHNSTVRSAQQRCFRRDDIPITAEAVIGSGVIETLAR